MQETSRDYATPYRPSWVRGLNAAWGALGEAWLPSLTVQAWWRAAEASSGWDREPFAVLAQSLVEEARLNPLGRMIVGARIVGALRARRHLEALEPPVDTLLAQPPLVIVGLQRTGTTFLHRMLSAVPGYRGLLSWEALQPAPGPNERYIDRRIRQAQLAAAAVRHLAPDFLAVHPIEPTEPEEEVVLLEQVGLSTGFEATLRVPSFAAWLESADVSPAYHWLRRVLRFLERDRPSLRWVLKTPHHLEWLPELLTVFPDARVVWTHRDPVAALPSFCSMVAHGHGLCTDEVDPAEIGSHWLRKVGRMVERGSAFRDAHPEVPFLDVDYTELVGDPMAVVANILDFAGAPLDEPARARIEAVRASLPQHKHGRHRYAAEDFGLNATVIADRLAEYRERYGFSPRLRGAS